MGDISLTDRIRGCLTGAAIGAELGFARCAEPERFAAATPGEMFDLELSPLLDFEHRLETADLYPSARPLVDLGVRAYLTANGRVTPEGFGHLFQDDEGAAFPSIRWDGLHTVQESLREGMPPRVAGLYTAPCGVICAAMPAVGIYHFAHPACAYLDGVELASVAQAQTGADWAGLAAAAIAAAFVPRTTGEELTNEVLNIIFERNRELFYDLDWPRIEQDRATEEEFLADWLRGRWEPRCTRHTNWIVYDPMGSVIPVVRRYADDPRKLMELLVVPSDFLGRPTVSAVIGGAIAGAMHGVDGFPAAWLAWAGPLVEPWMKIADIVDDRVTKEREVIEVVSALAAPQPNGDSLLRDKVRGCLLAGAIGNAMGSPMEGKFYPEIDAQYPDGITTVLDPSQLELQDDNQAAMHLVETYLAAGGGPVMARDLARTWEAHLNRDGFYCFCMGHAYDLVRQGADPRVLGHWSIVTGSTVMSMEPVGLYHIADPESAVIDATAISHLYQRGLDVTAACILVATVADAFRPEATVESVCETALAAAPDTPLRTFDRRAFKSCRDYLETCLEIADRYDDVMAAREELYGRCLFYHMIDPLEVLGLALAMLKIAGGDVRQAAIGGTNIGRDSDTIAGRAAMLAGTLRGAANVPGEWIELFSAQSLERIDHNADALAGLIIDGRLPRLRRRVELAKG